MRGVRVQPHDIVTPVAPTTGTRLATPAPLVVPIPVSSSAALP